MRLRGALCVLMAVLMYAWREIKEEGIDREEGRMMVMVMMIIDE